MYIVEFEIAFREEIDTPALRSKLAAFLKIPIAQIVDLNDYWDLESGQQKSHIGLTVYYSGSGLKTLAKGVCFLPLEGERMGDLAFYLAVELKTEVVIGDYSYPNHMVQDRSLIYFPNGSCARAISKWDGINEANEVELCLFGKSF